MERIRNRRLRLISLGFSASLAATLLGGVAPAAASHTPGHFTVALLGDAPYGDAQQAAFPRLVSAIDADPTVSLVLHAGDVKSGSSQCTDSRLTSVARLFNTFDDPFVLTPGDNEWTDCHTSAAGRYLPTERLTAVRRIFYPQPGRTLGGQPMTVTTQAASQPAHSAYRENVRFTRGGVVFATAHIVGSNNDLAPWSGLVGGDQPAQRRAEFDARRAANLAWINAAFDTAASSGAPAVVLLMQAEPRATTAWSAERSLIVRRATQFARPVLLVHGDEHVFEAQTNYAGVPKLTRLETFGETVSNWLALTVDTSKAQPFSWQVRRVP
jgi:Calcineurin-like phosphoesterase